MSITIIDEDYFKNGSLYIPNNKDINASPTATPTVRSKIKFFIDKYERELLLNALGPVYYNELQVDLVTPTDPKWDKLVNGETYVIEQKTKIWTGLKGKNKQSLIAFFVFCQYLKNDKSTYTTTGIIQFKAKNSKIVNSTPKFMECWSSFMSLYQGNLRSSYPVILIKNENIIGLDYFSQTTNVDVSLYQYLLDSNKLDENSFPDFEFKLYEDVNSFGI